MPDRRVTARAGVELVHWRWPGGEPAMLLLHGIGNYGRYWDLFADAVAGRLALVAPDARGHGESGRPADGYAPADFVADALSVLDDRAIERAVIVGHSMGGGHAALLAASHPERALALVLVDWSPEPLAEGAERARRLLFERPPSFADREAALAYLRETSPGYTDAVYENRLRWAFRQERGALVWRSDPNALRRIFASRAADAWGRVRAVHCPALVIRGTRSNVLSADVARRLAGELRARLVQLDAGHNVALDCPAELAKAVVDFARA